MKLTLVLALFIAVPLSFIYAFTETSSTFSLEATPLSTGASSISSTFNLFGIGGEAAVGTSSSSTFNLASGLIPEIFAPAGAASAFTQRNYAWAVNDGNLTTGGLQAAVNTAITSASSTIHRLRMDVAVSPATLAAGSKTFTLQYKTLGAGCSAAESWTTLGAVGSGSIWRGYDNTSAADGATLTNVLVNSLNIFESYEEDGVSVANPTVVTVGNAGEWDWVIQNNGATVGETYCFKMVKTPGEAPLNTYTNYPLLTVVPITSSGSGLTTTGGGDSTPASSTPSFGGTKQGGGEAQGVDIMPPEAGNSATPNGTGGGTGQGGGSGGGIDAVPFLFKKFADTFQYLTGLLASLWTG